ncbi:hypothetical protein F6X40_24160 [Paraburkholderia sp. UCT31]|uniref:hypothetical protein n=1 Tax=Paraburkholderia sp. UCT31 TaxID=2615209 RepID=UPI0016553ADA|nr:hypothetical protein [Paraburkholderia sp. UCT31]MBC8739812.1 hypothetical protein [Paraburkholderia sp. UCT31]
MAKKKSATLSKEDALVALQRTFEERFLKAAKLDADTASWAVNKHPDGSYVTASVAEQWKGFLLAHSKGPGGVTLSEPTPTVQRVVEELRAAAERRREAVGASDDGAAVELDLWANRLEARPDGIYEDVYEQITDMIEPQVRRALYNDDGPFPASVVDTVSILLEHWNRTHAAKAAAPSAYRILWGEGEAPAFGYAYVGANWDNWLKLARDMGVPLVALYETPDVAKCVIAAAAAVVAEALDDVDVHPCDAHNEEVKASVLHGTMRQLYDALKQGGFFETVS